MWNSIYINKNNIRGETSKAILIMIPLKAENYAGYQFWHPKSLMNVIGMKGYRIEIFFPNTWTFRIFKKTEEFFLNANQMCEIYEEHQMLDTTKKEPSVFVVKEPSKVEVKKVEAITELTTKSIQ